MLALINSALRRPRVQWRGHGRSLLMKASVPYSTSDLLRKEDGLMVRLRFELAPVLALIPVASTTPLTTRENGAPPSRAIGAGALSGAPIGDATHGERSEAGGGTPAAP